MRIRYLIAVTAIAVVGTFFTLAVSHGEEPPPPARVIAVTLTPEQIADCDAGGGCRFISVKDFLEIVDKAADLKLEEHNIFCFRGKRS